jgi:hypothetical protein
MEKYFKEWKTYVSFKKYDRWCEEMFVIHWEIISSELVLTGHGQPMDKEIAKKWAESLNKKHPEINHYIKRHH